MTKGFFLSLFIHLAIVATIFTTFKTPKLLATKTKNKVISLNHIVLKKQVHKTQPKIKPKPKPKPKPKNKPKKVSKPKRTIHKKPIKKIQRHKKTTHKVPKPKITKKASTPTIKQTFLNLNKSKIYEAIQKAKYYPPMAKRLKKQGTVKTCFDLLPNKEVKNITTQNANHLLQKGAYQTILNAKVNFPTPPKKVRVCLDINFRLVF